MGVLIHSASQNSTEDVHTTNVKVKTIQTPSQLMKRNIFYDPHVIPMNRLSDEWHLSCVNHPQNSDCVKPLEVRTICTFYRSLNSIVKGYVSQIFIPPQNVDRNTVPCKYWWDSKHKCLSISNITNNLESSISESWICACKSGRSFIRSFSLNDFSSSANVFLPQPSLLQLILEVAEGIGIRLGLTHVNKDSESWGLCLRWTKIVG